MLKPLQCPSCGAPLEYDEETERETMRCHFCNGTVMLPARTRAQQQNVRISFGRPQLRSQGSPKTGLIIVAVVVLLIGGGVVIGVINAINRAVNGFPPSTGSTNTRTAFNPPLSPPSRPPAPKPFFRKEGIGGAHFKDARSIALDRKS